MDAREHYKSEEEIEAELTDIYGSITLEYTTVGAGRFFRTFDETFFNACVADSLQWECDICNSIYEDKEDAEECCHEEESDEETEE